ncbi:hypothetical protein C7445_10794 [Alicyclobacillus sacchari]|uniref:Uncharacterized protein n=1 Tax=Alicyclobacillus sacchari TaxID=392010 RepID=A0A4R8LP44_9BACL|nr:hypothetical protein C7445_10794 [Alicyclobacillus sacchari]
MTKVIWPLWGVVYALASVVTFVALVRYEWKKRR